MKVSAGYRNWRLHYIIFEVWSVTAAKSVQRRLTAYTALRSTIVKSRQNKQKRCQIECKGHHVMLISFSGLVRKIRKKLWRKMLLTT